MAIPALMGGAELVTVAQIGEEFPMRWTVATLASGAALVAYAASRDGLTDFLDRIEMALLDARRSMPPTRRHSLVVPRS